MNTALRSVGLLTLGAALGALLAWCWLPGVGGERLPVAPARPGPGDAVGATPVRPGEAVAAPRLEGRPPPALEDLRPTEAEIQWLRSGLARERERLAAAALRADDSGLEVLERVLDRGTDAALTLFTPFETFRDRVRRPGAAPQAFAARGEAWVFAPPKLGATSVIDLGAGTFRIDDPNGGWSRLGPEVESLEVRGAGMDATTLVAGHPWAFLQSHGRAAGRSLTLRDLTFDGEVAEGALLDLRDAAAVRLERVRVRGWQLTGHAAAIGASGRTYLALDGCEFDGGGRAGGFALSLRGPAILWARGCTFSDLGGAAVIASGDAVKGGSVRLEACTFVNARVLDRDAACPVEAPGARVELGHKDLTEAERAARWGRAWLTSAEDLSLAPGIPRCVLGDLLDVLRRAEVPDGERVTHLGLEGLRDGKPSRFTLETRAAGRRRPSVYAARLDGGRLEMVLRPQGGGHGAPDEADLARVPSLRLALEHAAVASDVPLRVVEYALERGREGAPDAVVVRAYDDWQTLWDLDPTTGAVLRGPPGAK